MVSTVSSHLASPTKLNRAVAGTPVAQVRRQRVARANTAIRASVNENKMTTAAAVVATVLATPLAAQAVDATPSVSALLGSVVNGGVVVALIAGAISLVSGFDTVNRGR